MIVQWTDPLYCIRSQHYPQLLNYNPKNEYRLSADSSPDFAAYFGTTPEAAIMETLLRAELTVLTLSDLNERVLRAVEAEPLQLLDISGANFLRSKQDINAKQRIAMTSPRGRRPPYYRTSRAWAGQMLAKYPQIVGIHYSSVQHLGKTAIAVYPSRLPPTSQLHTPTAETIALTDPSVLPLIVACAHQVGIAIPAEITDLLK